MIPDAVGIVASDMKRSIDFYRLLGLNFPEFKVGEEHVDQELLRQEVRIFLEWSREKMARI